MNHDAGAYVPVMSRTACQVTPFAEKNVGNHPPGTSISYAFVSVLNVPSIRSPLSGDNVNTLST